MCLFSKRGITLAASVMLIVFVSISVLGVTAFIVQRLSQAETKKIQANCIYSAQAGVHHAVYNFRFHDLGAPNGYFTLGQTNIDANNYFDLSATAADLLMVDTSNSAFGPNNPNAIFRNLFVQNATNSQIITIDRMIISWNATSPLRRLNRIRIRNASGPSLPWITVWPQPGSHEGPLLSPANANISNTNLNTTPHRYEVELRFNNTNGIARINIQFVMTDGFTRTLDVLPSWQNYNFTVKSTGKTTGSNISREIQADYNALTSRITDYREIN